MPVFETSSKLLLGMIHLRALPGTPRSELSVREIAAIAAREARVLRESGFGGAIVENMHDAPYLKRSAGPEIAAAMTACALAVREAAGPAMKHDHGYALRVARLLHVDLMPVAHVEHPAVERLDLRIEVIRRVAWAHVFVHGDPVPRGVYLPARGPS